MTRKKSSPYREFTRWLFNTVPNVELEDWVVKVLNPRSVLCMFGNLNDITIFLNDYFNSFDVMYLDDREFYNFLKAVVHRYNINWKDLSFYKHAKMDKSVIELQKQLPILKKEEIYQLLEYSKEDPEHQSFMESLGLNKWSKKKTRKSKSRLSTNTVTMSDWIKNFS